jgi:hypothetical protein
MWLIGIALVTTIGAMVHAPTPELIVLDTVALTIGIARVCFSLRSGC